MAKDNLDKQFVIEFFRRKGIEVHLFSQSSVKSSPDFELYTYNDLFAYCELKSIVPCKSQSSNLPLGQIREVIINGKGSVNDIKKGIHKACKQLRSVNTDHKVPNIVFFINHNHHRNVGDLKDVIGVEQPNGPGFFCPLYKNKLIGKEDLKVVDYIIFLESRGREIRDKKECGEFRVLNDYAKDFLKYAGKDEKWAKKAICENWFSNIAYYFLYSESYFRDSLKEKISSKAYEILTNFANNRKKG